jgi:DNA-binding response OmpR family regulator
MGNGERILVVEDVLMLAEMVCDELVAAGFEPVGPSATVEGALRLMATSAVQAALLDVRLRDGLSFPIAYCLRDRGIPFAFLSGSDQRELPTDLSSELLIVKPPQSGELILALGRLVKR